MELILSPGVNSANFGSSRAIRFSSATTMKFLTASCLVSAATIPVLVAAHAGPHDLPARHAQLARQVTTTPSPAVNLATTSSPPSPPATTSPVGPAPGPTTPVTGAPPPPPPPGSSGVSAPSSVIPVTPTTTYTFSLQSTNPTAVPLSAIISTAPSSVTRPLDHTFTPGTQPTFLPGAPPLPNGTCLIVSMDGLGSRLNLTSRLVGPCQLSYSGSPTSHRLS